MCQLLGISANRAVDLTLSLLEWKHRSLDNPDGYGFACWRRGEPRIIKEPICLLSDGEGMDKILHFRSEIFICHVRFASCGERDGRNTHPFQHQSSHGNFVFAHNGTVKRIKQQRLEHLKPVGDTDSEHAFCWLLENLDRVPWGTFSARLKQLADQVRAYGNFNFLLSDGTTLWVYADNSVHYIQRTPPYGGTLVELKEEGYSINLAEVKAADEVAVLIATEPLTDEGGWKWMAQGELLALRDGQVVERFA